MKSIGYTYQVFISVFLLLAIMVKSMVPVGFMLDHKNVTGTQIVICSGVEEKVIQVDENNQPLKEGASSIHLKVQKDVCPFSVHGYYTMTVPVVIGSVIDILYQEIKIFFYQFNLDNYRVDIPQSRGPPIIL